MAGKKKQSAAADPSGLRAAGKKLADDEAAKKQGKLPIKGEDKTSERQDIELPTPINATEVQHLSLQLARLQGDVDAKVSEIAATEEKHRAELKDLKKSLADMRKEATKTAREIRDEARYTLTPVRIERDFAAGQVRYFRLDPNVGTLYDQKAMDPEERNKALFEKPPEGERVTVDDEEPTS